ncbi:winged helix-turn-helix domain-containing protein [Streptomyces sp. NPDC014995]|uniref:winged helix-turn-helix domain-containing protein n=1 Tax=Streptomyces sp. NPDC014995 TaxID=3364936 RepID=UPI0036FDA3FA
MPNQRPRVLSDVDALKALAHPLRQELPTRLQRHGPATSADLAAEFDEHRGATGYHPRAPGSRHISVVFPAFPAPERGDAS